MGTTSDSGSVTTVPRRRADADLTLKPLGAEQLTRMLAGVVAIALLATGIASWAPWRDRPDATMVALAADRDAAFKTGTDASVAFNTIDYRTIGKTTKTWLATSTGALAEQVRESRRALATRAKGDRTRSTAEAIESALATYDRSAGTASVITLLSIHTDKRGEKPVTNQVRFQVALQRIDSEWKATHLQAVEVNR